MKTITVILVVFCAYLHAAENKETGSANILEDAMEDVGDAIDKVIPKCIFGVQWISAFLYDSATPQGREIDLDGVECENFDPSKPIVFLVHGFVSAANYTNNYKLAEILVQRGFTVVALDWSDAACANALPILNLLTYPNAVANTIEIGELMASYIKMMINRCNVSLKNMIFVGHSLGAHVCGFASKQLQKDGYDKVPLLYGVDPAELLFGLSKCEHRLCKTDADKTIVLHTSVLGIMRPIGHTDLYFNDGYILQSGCAITDVSCAHSRGILYLANSLKSDCGFPGVPTTFRAITSPISKPSYPKPDSTDCFVMDRKMFNINRGFDKLKGKIYYMFVKSGTLCTKEKFSCEH